MTTSAKVRMRIPRMFVEKADALFREVAEYRLLGSDEQKKKPSGWLRFLLEEWDSVIYDVSKIWAAEKIPFYCSLVHTSGHLSSMFASIDGKIFKSPTIDGKSPAAKISSVGVPEPSDMIRVKEYLKTVMALHDRYDEYIESEWADLKPESAVSVQTDVLANVVTVTKKLPKDGMVKVWHAQNLLPSKVRLSRVTPLMNRTSLVSAFRKGAKVVCAPSYEENAIRDEHTHNGELCFVPVLVHVENQVHQCTVCKEKVEVCRGCILDSELSKVCPHHA